MQLIKLPPFENYMYKLTQAVGALKIMAASRYYHKGVFDLSEEAVVQEVVEKGLVVGSKTSSQGLFNSLKQKPAGEKLL
ncbi:hypothetical protein Y1Q_0003218 [Alligator mississippiensis]|uniref:Uncharacterized protein n=1 Tax=Alligator mississippiensis TaxID=8496 RepID=A0A151MDY8_ALLMI|nr:hypothetical protein Y1Q_0003218 [Alligator mississippiensis]